MVLKKSLKIPNG